LAGSTTQRSAGWPPHWSLVRRGGEGGGLRHGVAGGSTLRQDAFAAFLRGRAGWTRFDAQGLATAVTDFEAAVGVDPGFVTAYTGLAEALSLRALFRATPSPPAFEAAIAAASQALRLAPDDPAALAAPALARLYGEHDRAAALELFERALARDPGRALTHQWAAGAYSAAGQHDRALAMVRRARELDPLSASVNGDLCWYAYFARHFEEAASHAEHAFRAFGRASVLQCAQLAYWRLGDSVRERDALVRHLGATAAAGARELLIRAFADGGMTAFRSANTQRLESSSDPADEYARTVAQVADGSTGHALEFLGTPGGVAAPWSVFLDVDPSFDALRSAPGFSTVRSAATGGPLGQ
jgi:tetratricopeptide (TPR) repeat protein